MKPHGSDARQSSDRRQSLLDLLYVYDVVELVNLVVNNPLLLGTQLVVC